MSMDSTTLLNNFAEGNISADSAASANWSYEQMWESYHVGKTEILLVSSAEEEVKDSGHVNA